MGITSKPQFRQGKNVEAYLDDLFRFYGYEIKQTTPHQERVQCLGDRLYSRDGQSFFVEYKSGIQTKYTGNVFLETISVDTTCKPGWVYTCNAAFIFYAALLNEKILIFEPHTLREKIGELSKRFREVKTVHQQNDGYNTHGIVVPLAYAETQLAKQVITLDGK